MFQRITSKAPAACVIAALGVTFGGARLFSLVLPRVHWEPFPGMHIHHYVYGIFILAAAGYFALLFRGDRARSWIALLYGLGLGLTFDEFGMWINPPFVRGVRWNTTGLTISLTACALAGIIPILLRRKRSIDRSVPTIERTPAIQNVLDASD
jgi:hypothetical protein